MKKICLSLLLTFVALISMAQTGKFHEFQHSTSTGQNLPYVLFEPAQQNQKRPLIVYLHGAISRTSVSAQPVESAKKVPFTQLAEEKGYYVLYPYGKKDATWFEPVGINMVLSEIKTVCEKFNIDTDKIFLSGFSDGASGTLYLAATQSSPFAGFIALNGSLAVAATLGKTPLYLENLNEKPLYIVNTQGDLLYPAAPMQPIIEKIRQHHLNTTFRSPKGNHEMSYFPSLKNEISTFIDQHQRQIPDSISLEVSDSLANTYAWLRITAIDTLATAQNWHKPYSLKMTNEKASFGLAPDLKYTGKEMRVAGFGKNSLAKQMGVQIGDLITHMEDSLLQGPMTSFNYLASKKAGQTTNLTLLRNGEKIVLHGQFPPAYTYEIFTRQAPSAKIIAKITPKQIDLRCSKTTSFEIDFSLLPFKKGKNITLVINGKAQKVKAKGKQSFLIPA